jgi:meiotically up-regulated gene 157 (Mug157) protein
VQRSVALIDPRTTVGALRGFLVDRGVAVHRIGLACAALDLLLRRAISLRNDGTVFVATGDIEAMWLRDSAAQVRPLLVLAKELPALVDLVAGVLRAQVEQVLIDSRANAFNAGPTGVAMRRDFRDQSPWVFERKYAVDSLCAPLTLAWLLWRTTGSVDHVDGRFREAASAIVTLWRSEQEHEPGSFVLRRFFSRRGDTLSHRGRGAPIARTGMTWSGFRPSDDACVYGYNVPANAFAAVSLERLAELIRGEPLAEEARTLASEIRDGIARHGIVDDPVAGRIYAYEVDGLGHTLLLDDANVPNLVSLPYLGFCAGNDPLYRATRAWALSPRNPLWSDGGSIRGVGSTHTRRGFVWPLGIAMEGLTATDDEEREDALRRLDATVVGNYLFHESIHPRNPARFTRRWFSWADMLYVELVLAAAGAALPG